MMWTALRKWWKYLGAKASVRFDEVADPKVQLEQAIVEARDQHRKLAERQNATALQGKLEQRAELLSTLDQAKMHEQMHAAMAQLEASVGDDVPTFAQVQQKIDARLARAQGMAELAGTSVDVQMLE